MLKTIQFKLISALALAVLLAWGQGAGGVLSGKVTTAAGAGVPSAAVTVTEVNTNLSRKVLTGPDGSFNIDALPAGNYRVDVEMAGFKRTSQNNVELNPAAPASVNIALEAGSMNESVEIRGSAPVVQDRSAEVSTALNTRTVRELPLIDRNRQQLLMLQTGITPPVPIYDMIRDPEANRFFSTNGQSPFANLWEMDGVVNQEPFRGAAIRVQPAENVQEMNIVTGSYSVQRGFSGGAITTGISRPGTNGLHGSLFEFNSNNDLRSRPYFSAPGNPVPRFVYNQFGATVGGAIVPDKLFFFGSYEGTYNRGNNTTVNTVPLAGITGNFSSIPGLVIYNPLSGSLSGAGRTPFAQNIIPAALLNRSASAIAGLLPAPNQPGLVNNYISNAPYQDDANKFDGRIDHRFGDRTSGFLRYGYTNRKAHLDSPLGGIIGSTEGSRVVAQNVVANIDHAIGDGLISDFRFGYNRFTQNNQFLGNQSSLLNSLGFGGAGNRLIGINVPGMPAIGGAPDIPMFGVDNTFNFASNWSLHTSSHNLKFGVDIRRIRSDGFANPMFGSNGTAYFGPGATMLPGGPGLSRYGELYNSYAALLLGSPSQLGIQSYITTPTVRQWQSAVWVGDTLQIMNRLSAEVGVRYEVYSPLQPRNTAGAQFFDPATNTFNYAGVGGVSIRSSRYDLDNVAPRVGLAFRLTNRTAIRAGYSMSYFQTPYIYSGFMAPAAGAVSGVQGGYTVAPFAGPFSPVAVSAVGASNLQNGAPASNLPASVINRNLQTPFVHSYNLQVQQDFYYGTLLSVGYVGSLGRQLPYSYQMNAALPGAGNAGLPFAPFGRTASTLAYTSGANTNYNSLQASLTKRFSRGLAFTGAYTWSRALGYTTDTGMLLNPFNYGANYGPLDYDRTQVLSISHLWELPFGRKGSSLASTLLGGWQLNGVFSWQTGTPLTITADPVTCACPGNTVLASVNGAVPFGSGTTYLTGNGFSAPAAGQFGNLGRGAIRGPDTWNYNMSLFKSFRVRDRFNLELRGEAYNLTNTPHYANPVTNFGSPAFGQITSMTAGAFGRQLNVGVRVLF